MTQIVDSSANGYARFEAANGVTLSIHVGDGDAGGTTTYLESGALDAWVAYLARARGALRPDAARRGMGLARGAVDRSRGQSSVPLSGG
ncbi:hypothetical protein [Sphingopyxis terrae]|uniref:hypothetical protein n=1 Tax=Sphingopyxis terrae TaxID=33052 RepID=UPI00360CA25E